MGLKLIGLGINTYVRDGYNLFDGLIVVISLVELNIDILFKNNSSNSTI